ncbi:MAG: putative DNA binding domain-containing protein [Spirochaetaceae bacterium]|nr:putative DNA binding domain-containing protein [Spirochaetaceae bacterium]
MNLNEGPNVEFKREYTEELKKTVLAFANTSGGTLYIGVADDRTVCGVDNPDDTLLKVSSSIRNSINPDVTLFTTCRAERIEGAVVVVVTVQKGTARPYYLTGKGIRPEGVYVRQGASSVPASEAAILKMLRETGGETYESVRSLNQDLTFRAAEKVFASRKIAFGPPQKQTLRLLAPDGMYTNLALLLSDQSVHTIKLAVFEDAEKVVFRDRRELSGSLFTQMSEAYDFLDRYNRTHAEVKGLYRSEQRDYPEQALREALLNVLVHRDYAHPGSSFINIFEDRVEFVSLGSLPEGMTLEDITLGLSVLRNKNLAGVFYRLHLIESYGMGIPTIMRSYADCPRKPVLQATGNAFKVTLPNRNENPPFYPEAPAYSGMVSDSAAPYAVRPGRALTEGEAKALDLFKTRPVIVRRDIEAALSISQAMAVRLLRGLLDKGAIRSRGGGKNTRYEAL